MRDPRLLQEWAVAADIERREAVSQLLAAISRADRAAVDRVLVQWWASVLAQDCLGDQWKAARVESLRRTCSSLPLESQKLALTAANALSRDTNAKDRGIGARLLGESAARIVRSSSTSVELDRAVMLLSERWDAVEALMEALLRYPPWPESTETLAVTGVAVDGLLGHHFGRVPSNETLIEYEDTARERGVVGYFWGYYPELYLNETTLVRLTLVARREWAAAALQADALPLCALRDDLWLHLHLHEDRSSILALLRASPPVFASERWTGSTSALAALRAAIRHADQLHARLSQLTRTCAAPSDAGSNLRTLEAEEVPAWLTEVAQATVARSDGRQLLLLFAARLVRQDLIAPWNGQRSWSSARPALRAIHDILDPTPSVDELRRVANSGEVPSNRTTVDHATYLVTSGVCDAAPREVWAWYRELLLQCDDGLCWQAKSWRRALCYETLAESLVQLSNPFDEWRAVWKALFVTDRERARFETLDDDALYPSLHLLRVGGELLRHSPSRAGAPRFFDELLAYTQRLLVNDGRFISSLQPELIFDAIDAAPCVLGSDWPRALEPYRPLLSNAENRLHVARLLLEGGASFGEIEAIVEVAGHRLADSVAELKQSNGVDLNVHRQCELVMAAAKAHAPARSNDAR